MPYGEPQRKRESHPKLVFKMERRLGKIQARHPSVNDLYEVALRDTDEGVRLFWQLKEDRKNWRESREGAYLLRTKLQNGHRRTTVGEVYAVDRSRSLFPSAEERAFDSARIFINWSRVKAHVMVAFLGYALWVTLKHLLKRREAVEPKPSASGVDNAQPLSPMKALSPLSTLQSADIVLPTADGREIRLRRITEPTPEQKSLLHQLRLSLPDRLESNRGCSVDSAKT
jgi:hypothetical protein